MRRLVRSADVVGSVGRSSESNPAFLPAGAGSREKHKHADKAFRAPPRAYRPWSSGSIRGRLFEPPGGERLAGVYVHLTEPPHPRQKTPPFTRTISFRSDWYTAAVALRGDDPGDDRDDHR